MTKFSIIVPIFNAEKTLCRCLDSILHQQYDDYEVILVDDGSRDASYDICEHYKKADHRIRLFCQENGGPSKARNLGIEKANGEWICFVDSDDYISELYLKELNEKITKNDNLDMIFMGYHKINFKDKKIEQMIPRDSGKKGMELAIDLVAQGMFGYTWIKIFKKIKIKDIRFHEGINLFEDEIFTCEALTLCSQIDILSRPIYYYIQNGSASLMQRTYDDYCEKCDEAYKIWKKILISKIERENYRYFLQSQANLFVTRCIYYGLERKVYVKDYFSRLERTSFFKEHTNISEFDRYIAEKKYFKIWLNKKKYKIKCGLALCIRRMYAK